MNNFTSVHVLDIKSWSESLYSITIEKPDNYEFIPGQYAYISVSDDSKEPLILSINGNKDLNTNDNVNTESINTEQNVIHFKPYSIVSTPFDDYIEFLATITAPRGEASELFYDLKIGNTLYIKDKAAGSLITSFLRPTKHLFLFSTGSGLSPFLSILRSASKRKYIEDNSSIENNLFIEDKNQDEIQNNKYSIWNKFDNIYFVHTVRQLNELAYKEYLSSYCAPKENQLFYYIPIVTREGNDLHYVNGTREGFEPLYERIPQLMEKDVFDDFAGEDITPQNSTFMLCGNPAMISEVQSLLESKGFLISHSNTQQDSLIYGQIVTESYW